MNATDYARFEEKTIERALECVAIAEADLQSEMTDVGTLFLAGGEIDFAMHSDAKTFFLQHIKETEFMTPEVMKQLIDSFVCCAEIVQSESGCTGVLSDAEVLQMQPFIHALAFSLHKLLNY